MHDSALAAEGFAFYVAELKRGADSPYFAYRVFEKSWQVAPNDRDVVRAATVRLIETDPWFLATAMPHFLSALTTEDIKRLTPFVGAGQSRAAAAMLRATLWFHARRGAHHPDKAGRLQLKQALLFLGQVPKKARDGAWHVMAVGCHRILDFDAYKRAFPALHEATDPAWRAMGLCTFLKDLTGKDDWKTYDRFRPQWDQLPPDHHACQCYLNDLHTNDGLRAVAAGRWAAVPHALAKAADVHGCPHLNSGGLRLDLIRVLLSKKQELSAARTYLQRAAAFEARPEEVEALQRTLDRLSPAA